MSLRVWYFFENKLYITNSSYDKDINPIIPFNEYLSDCLVGLQVLFKDPIERKKQMKTMINELRDNSLYFPPEWKKLFKQDVRYFLKEQYY